ncbi:MAG TPA: class I SAM-dependent methyltransferase [Armatimonadota bacterium]|nr:class I SAM-dependent methyltransferase [Armatimonadota bacterium]
MAVVLEHRDAQVLVDELQGGKRRMSVRLFDKSAFMPIASLETAYPESLIRQVLEVKGPAFLCDEIARDEDPSYVHRSLCNVIFAHTDEDSFRGKSILDFGCGCGSSSMVLGRLFPGAEIVGAELTARSISVARARAEHYGFSNISFHVSPSGEELPKGIGPFDFVIMSGVYEHLLPRERQVVMPLIWSVLKPGGILFLDQTPHRYFFAESHTTGLLFINYLPDRLALLCARKFSRRVAADESWAALLRTGIRGGTVREITSIIKSKARGMPMLLKPCRLGFRDAIDVWYAQPSWEKNLTLKRWLRYMLKVLKYTSGVTLVPSLSIAIKKLDGQ